MASNKNKNQAPQQQQQPQRGYGPNPTPGGNDPKGRMQNQIGYQQQRYESQQGPMADAMGYNYGRGTESDYGNYTDIMNQYRDIASGSGSSGGGGGGGGGPAFSFGAHTVSPQQVGTERASVRGLGPLERVTASDPYNSYAGMQEFSQTGGYSPADISNMRARGVAPIRAAYGNAEREVGRQRSLQGGYSPNSIAAQIKMAREQGQGMADASQNVEAGLAQARNQGRLSGLQGMGNIESNRQQAQMQADLFNAGQSNEGQKFDIGNEMNVSQFNAGQGNNMGQFNADLDFRGQQYNADAYTQADARNAAAAESAASRNAASAAQSNDDRFRALAGMQNLYGTTPGMSNMFGNQLMNAVGQGGNMGMGYINAEQGAGQLPGQYEQTRGRINDMLGYASKGGDVLSNLLNNRNQGRQQQPQRPNYNIPINQNFNPGNYGQQVRLGTPPPVPFNPYGQTYDEG